MSSVIDNNGKVAKYISVCKQMGVEVLPPDINEGVAKFSISNGKIRYGLSGIKSVGGAVVDRIEAERTKNGPFKDLRNFLTRMPSKDTNKKTVEALILSGAFDDMGGKQKADDDGSSGHSGGSDKGEKEQGVRADVSV